MKTFTSFRKLSAEYDTETKVVRVAFSGHEGWFTVRVDEVRFHGKKVFDWDSFGKCKSWIERKFDSQVLHIEFSDGPIEQECFNIVIVLSKEGLHFKMDVMGHFEVFMSGTMSFGAPGRPVCFNRRGVDLRSAFGPATSAVDNALFNVDTDSALEVLGPSFRMKYDWDNACFNYTMHTDGDDIVRDFSLRLHEHVFERMFGIPYAPMNHNTCFPVPPVGWMTWYAVQFDACEETVLENARFQKEHLAPYGANAIWVDWEWYHSDFSGTNKPGTDTFHPDPDRYPNGLGHLADEIKALGLIPALWIGATNDPNLNEFLEANPDALLVQKRSWCGQFFIDPTHPKVRSEYIPRVFKNIRDMGYMALKWDCLPITFDYVDKNHDRMYDPSHSTDEVMRELVKIARETVGKDFYMLSCSGESKRDMLFAGDIFDAARIGGDIFRWSEFITNGVDRMLAMYPYHNTLLYADPDNVVIRPKYNTFDQAVSRVSIVSMLGMPFTLGDNLPELDSDRLKLIQHAIPVLDIHPMDIRENPRERRQLIINLAIATRNEDWNVVDVLNLLDEDCRIHVSLQSDLHLDVLPGERYLLFDFWNRKPLGEVSEGFDLNLRACASRVICVRKKTGLPQILSTTRHISQGALELSSVHFDPKVNVLSGVSDIVAGDDYALYIYVPEGLRIFHEGNSTTSFGIERIDVSEEISFETQCPNGSVWKVCLDTSISGPQAWSIGFTPCHAT
jgi:hypothetical protein